jgi:hypothetical protein
MRFMSYLLKNFVTKRLYMHPTTAILLKFYNWFSALITNEIHFYEFVNNRAIRN